MLKEKNMPRESKILMNKLKNIKNKFNIQTLWFVDPIIFVAIIVEFLSFGRSIIATIIAEYYIISHLTQPHLTSHHLT